MTPRKYLEHQAENLTDGISITCSTRKCGQCRKLQISGQIAKDMLAKRLPPKAIRAHSDLVRKAWEKSKFYRTYLEGVRLGKDPFKYMKSKGLQP